MNTTNSSSFVQRLRRRLFGPSRSKLFSEYLGSWREANQSVSGYGSDAIPEQVRIALKAVQEGKAEHERDGVLFREIEYSWPLLAAVMCAAATNNGSLRVLDFGGSLGTTYFQNRRYLSQLDSVEWLIVEQESFVTLGKKDFESKNLAFTTDISDALNSFGANVVVCSSSLQYVESPAHILDQISRSSAQHLVLDRTPFNSGPADILTIQTVPPEIYTAQYPAWVMSWPKLKAKLNSDWHLLSRFETLEDEMRTKQGTYFFWQGAHFVRNTSPL